MKKKNTIIDPKACGAYLRKALLNTLTPGYAANPDVILNDPYFDALALGDIPEKPIKTFSELSKADRNPFHVHFGQSTIAFELHDALGQVELYSHVYSHWIYQVKPWLEGKRALEVCAGRYGLMTYAFQQCGIPCIATDPLFDDYPEYQFTNVERLDYKKAIDKYSNEADILIIGWAIHEDWTDNITRYWKSIKPNGLTLLVGEYGGCCGVKEMYHSLQDDALAIKMPLPRAFGIKERVELFVPADTTKKQSFKVEQKEARRQFEELLTNLRTK